MTNTFNMRAIAPVLFCIALSPAAVSAVDFLKDKDAVWQASANEFIRYDDQDRAPGNGNGNDHPATLDGEQLRTILGLIRLREDGAAQTDSALKPLFTDQQAALLGEQLEKGLMHAPADRDIIFALERSVDRLMGLKPDRYFVAGRAFYKDSRLNIIIGDYDLPRNDAYEAAYDPTHRGIVRYHFNFGSRSRPSRFTTPLAAVDGVANKRLADGERRDWLVIDIAAASRSHQQQTELREQTELQQKREEMRRILGDDTATGGQAHTPPPAARSLEQRLRELKRLHDEDLITGEDYARKRKQLLDEL